MHCLVGVTDGEGFTDGDRLGVYCVVVVIVEDEENVVAGAGGNCEAPGLVGVDITGLLIINAHRVAKIGSSFTCGINVNDWERMRGGGSRLFVFSNLIKVTFRCGDDWGRVLTENLKCRTREDDKVASEGS